MEYLGVDGQEIQQEVKLWYFKKEKHISLDIQIDE